MASQGWDKRMQGFQCDAKQQEIEWSSDGGGPEDDETDDVFDIWKTHKKKAKGKSCLPVTVVKSLSVNRKKTGSVLTSASSINTDMTELDISSVSAAVAKEEEMCTNLCKKQRTHHSNGTQLNIQTTSVVDCKIGEMDPRVTEMIAGNSQITDENQSKVNENSPTKIISESQDSSLNLHKITSPVIVRRRVAAKRVLMNRLKQVEVTPDEDNQKELLLELNPSNKVYFVEKGGTALKGNTETVFTKSDVGCSQVFYDEETLNKTPSRGVLPNCRRTLLFPSNKKPVTLSEWAEQMKHLLDEDEDVVIEDLSQENDVDNLPNPAVSESPGWSITSGNSTESSTLCEGDTQMKGSLWLQHVKEKLCTPEKSTSTSPSQTQEDLDSVRKKKKHKQIGLAQKLQRVLKRHTSNQNMWKHQRQSQEQSSKVLDLVICSIVSNTPLVQTVCRPRQELCNECGKSMCFCMQTTIFVFFSKETWPELNLKLGQRLQVYPPWQELVIPDVGRPVIFASLFSKSVLESTGDVENHPDVKTGDTGERETISFTWNCLCKLASTLCTKRPNLADITQRLLSSISRHSPAASRLQTVEVTHSSITKPSGGVLAAVESGGGCGIDLTLLIQRIFKYRCGRGPDSVLYSLLGQDSLGVFCEVVLPSEIVLQNHEEWMALVTDGAGTVYEIKGLSVVTRTNASQCSGLYSVMSSLDINATNQTFWYTLSGSVGDTQINMVESTVNNYLPPITRIFPEVTEFLSSAPTKRCSFCGVCVLVHNKWLYIQCDGCEPYCRVKLYRGVWIDPRVENQHPVSLMLVDIGWYCGFLFADRYSRVIVLNDHLQVDLPSFKMLPFLQEDSLVGDLISLNGVITGVEERTAYSWQVCENCGSENLDELRGEFCCRSCQYKSKHTRNKMALTVYIQSVHLKGSSIVKVKLCEETIKKLLPLSEQPYMISVLLRKELYLTGVLEQIKKERKLATTYIVQEIKEKL